MVAGRAGALAPQRRAGRDVNACRVLLVERNRWEERRAARATRGDHDRARAVASDRRVTCAGRAGRGGVRVKNAPVRVRGRALRQVRFSIVGNTLLELGPRRGRYAHPGACPTTSIPRRGAGARDGCRGRWRLEVGGLDRQASTLLHRQWSDGDGLHAGDAAAELPCGDCALGGAGAGPGGRRIERQVRDGGVIASTARRGGGHRRWHLARPARRGTRTVAAKGRPVRIAMADIDLMRGARDVGALGRVSLIADPQEIRTVPAVRRPWQARPTTCLARIVGGGPSIIVWRKGLRWTASHPSEYEEGEEM